MSTCDITPWSIYLQYSWLIAILAVWSLLWKGIALWKAARVKQNVWFVILLIINTIGILDILYIFIFFPKDKNKEK